MDKFFTMGRMLKEVYQLAKKNKVVRPIVLEGQAAQEAWRLTRFERFAIYVARKKKVTRWKAFAQ